MYIDKLDDIVNEYNDTYHSTIKMKPVDVKSSTYIDSSKEINDEDPKPKIGDNLRISIYENIFAKGYVPNQSEEVLWLKILKTLCRGQMLLVILKEKNFLFEIGMFYEKELQKTNQKKFKSWKSN